MCVNIKYSFKLRYEPVTIIKRKKLDENDLKIIQNEIILIPESPIFSDLFTNFLQMINNKNLCSTKTSLPRDKSADWITEQCNNKQIM